MKLVKLLLLVAIIQICSFAQLKYTDALKSESVFTNVPDVIKNRKPFMREWWFYEQRAFPYDNIPEDAYMISQLQSHQLSPQIPSGILDVNWVSLGPSPGAYFNYGNISSRIVTGAYDPVNPNIIYVGPANGGVWKSTDAGFTWKPLTDNEVSMSMGAIEIDATNTNIIYAGTGEATYSGASYYGRGLLKSTDGGASWVNFTAGLPSSTFFSRIKIRRGNSSQLLAALGNSGLYRSIDAGENWTRIITGRIDDVIFSPSGDTAFAVGGASGLRRSTDGGQTFNSFGTGLLASNRTHFDLCLSNPAYMYAAVYGSGTVKVFKSSDYGGNWSELAVSTSFQNQGGQAWYDLYCRVNPKNPNKVYIGTIDVYRSTDGINFTNITNGYAGGNVHVDQHYLFFHPTLENEFIVCNDGGVWRTTNNGNSFSNLNQSLTLTQFYRIAVSPFNPNRILGGTQDNGTQQTFSTLSWAAAFGGDGGEVSFNSFNQNFIIGETQNGGLVRTTNGGSNWTNARTGINDTEKVAWVAPIQAHPSISGTFFVARQKIYKSTNNGGLWTAISVNINGSSAIRELAISNTDPTIMFATSGSQVFKSSDSGVNWSNVTTGLPNRTITSVYVHPSNSNLVFLTFSGFSTSKIYKSTNGGISWTSISGNLPDSPVNDLLVYTLNNDNPNTYFAATDIGVFLSVDDGLNWSEITNGLPNTVIMHLDFSASTQMLRAGTHGRGVYEAFIDFTNPVSVGSEFIPSEITISQNYPNPFNPKTKIKYSLSTESNVRITMYNSLGQKIETIKNLIESAGSFEITWDAENFASGIYFYSFEVNDLNGRLTHKEMKKLVLMK